MRFPNSNFTKIKTSGTASIDEILNLTIKGSYSLNMLLLFCEFGEQMSERFEEIYDLSCRMDWYLFPTDVQRMMPMILMGTQKPVVINGYGNVACTRLTFKTVASLKHYL